LTAPLKPTHNASNKYYSTLWFDTLRVSAFERENISENIESLPIERDIFTFKQ